MASTRTFNFASQKTAWGEIEVTLVSHFASGSGNTNYNEPASIMDLGLFKYKMPEEGVILHIDNVSFEFSDFDDLFGTTVIYSGSEKANKIEATVDIDGTTIFKGYVDLQSFVRDFNYLKTTFNICSVLSELRNQSVENDLKSLISTSAYFGKDCFNLKICIDKIFSLVGIGSGDIHWDVDIRFFDSGSTDYDYSEVWLVYSDFFGGSVKHDFLNCLDLLKSFLLSLGAVAIFDGQDIYIEDFQNVSADTISNIIKKRIIDYTGKVIDGLIVSAPVGSLPPDENRGEYQYGNNIKTITTYFAIEQSAIVWNMAGDNGVDSDTIYEIDFGDGSPKTISDKLADYYWDFYSVQRKEIELDCIAKKSNQDEVTVDSEDYQLFEAEHNYTKGKGKYVGRVM